MKKAEAAGFKVLYGDTDSLMLLYPKGGEEKVKEFQKGVNAALPEKMELELEDFYPRGIFVSKKQTSEKNERGAKKKYALINREGKIKIRGFELVRRDWSRVARNTQREVLRILLAEGDVRKAVELVRETVKQLKEGKTPLSDCVMYTQLQKSTAAYEVKSPELGAVMHARKHGLTIPEGSVVAFVITKKGNSISEKAQVAELARDYDADYYVNNQVLPAVLKILGALGVDEEDIKTKGTQSRLGGWG
jgi:DNA polymerase I